MSNFTHETIEQMDRDELVTACKALVDQLDGGEPELIGAVVKLSKLVTAMVIEFGMQDECDCGNPRWGINVDVSPEVGEYILMSEHHLAADHTHLTVEKRSDHHEEN